MNKNNAECKWMIQGLSAGQWDESAVSEDSESNTFDTYEDAEKMIPSLARDFGCPRDEFRVVERK